MKEVPTFLKNTEWLKLFFFFNQKCEFKVIPEGTLDFNLEDWISQKPLHFSSRSSSECPLL